MAGRDVCGNNEIKSTKGGFMLTRRDFVLGAAAAGALMHARFSLAKAAQPTTAVNFDVPAGACDCHTHIHGDPAKFPWFPGRTYTPEMALPEEMSALHKALRIQRVVIVTPSVYGPDNSASIYGMKARGKDARGVAVIDDKTTDTEIDKLAGLGFKGIRLNLATSGVNDPKVARERFIAAAARIKRVNWHVQLNTSLAVIAAMKDALAASPVPIVFDHFGGAKEELGVSQAGFSDLVDLVKSGKAFVKISVTAGPRKNYEYFTPLAQMLIAANVDRILWGTNWPHPNSVDGSTAKVSPLFQVDDGYVLNLLPKWAPDAAVRKKILVDNPAKLYAF
jgi:predicted TIM-barrel fold metal-dependent hydrolase